MESDKHLGGHTFLRLPAGTSKVFAGERGKEESSLARESNRLKKKGQEGRKEGKKKQTSSRLILIYVHKADAYTTGVRYEIG